VNADSLWNILHKSRGNWRELTEFISSVPNDKKNIVFPLLSEISEKDLHDATVEVLNDNILYSMIYQPMTQDKAIFSAFILSPRVDNEYLKPFKEFFQEKFVKDFILNGRKNPETIVKWVKGSIAIDEDANYARAPITPRGVYELKVADLHSRDIFFVAVCRSFGIPSRLETATRTPQYFFNGKWHDVYFTNPPSKTDARGKLVLTNDKENNLKPEYYTHFTIEKFTEGFFRSLDYETEPILKSFPCTIEVMPGSYLLVTGNRINGGTVLATLSFFNLQENKTENLDIKLRQDLAPEQVIGKTGNMEEFLKKISDEEISVDKKGMIIAWLDAEKEPSRHFIADLIQHKKDLDKWNGSTLLLFRSAKEKDLFMSKNGTGLPLKTKSAVVKSGSLEYFLQHIQKKTISDLPVVTFIKPGGQIIYFSEGYKIGTEDEILRHLHSSK
jgi:hypothetical protein